MAVHFRGVEAVFVSEWGQEQRLRVPPPPPPVMLLRGVRYVLVRPPVPLRPRLPVYYETDR